MNDKLKIGDIITAYHKGIHKVIKITPNDKSYKVEYEKIFNENMTVAAKKINSTCIEGCDKIYVHQLEEKRDEIQKNYNNVIYYLNSKKMNSLELEDLPDYGHHMLFSEFEKCVIGGGFIDSDGYGHYATKNKMTDEIIYPSYFKDGLVNRSFSHIVWFNK